VKNHEEQGTNPLLILVRGVRVDCVLPVPAAFVLSRAVFRPLIGLDLSIERVELGFGEFVGMMDMGGGVFGGCRGLDRSVGSGVCSGI
jgi:hypothetical protein